VNFFGDPGAIRDAARVFAHQAELLANAGREAEAIAARVQWQAPRADRFRQSIAGHRADAQRRAEELMHISQDLVRVAAKVQAELDVIHRLEGLVRSAISAFIPQAGVPAPWESAGWHPGNLPASGDPAWERLARSLGIR